MYDRGVMSTIVEQIESCLATVQRTLDLLSSRGRHEAAYDLARAHYAASIRSTWPSNLAGLSDELARIAGDMQLELTVEERREIELAARTLRGICNQ
jgi:hypothetical protein